MKHLPQIVPEPMSNMKGWHIARGVSAFITVDCPLKYGIVLISKWDWVYMVTLRAWFQTMLTQRFLHLRPRQAR